MNLDAQLIEATAEVQFIPRDPADNAVFELHNALHVDAAEAEDGTTLRPIRYRQDSTIHLSFPETLAVGKPQVIRFRYGGRLVGYEDSPAEGYSLAEITADRAVLLYSGRWFPVNGHGADRFTSDIRITVPDAMKVLGSGLGTRTEALEGIEHRFEFGYPSFPGSIAIVADEPPVQVSSGDASSQVYMPTASEDLAMTYGETAADMVEFFSDLYGAPYSKSLAIVEMGDYAPNGYWAPGMIFLSPYGRQETLNRPLLGKLVANQWWGALVGAGNRNHLWLVDGLAQYSALLETEEAEGEEVFVEALSKTRIEALTFDQVPLRESSRIADFSPQMNALTSARGAMVLNMLRWRVGDETFFGTLRELVAGHTWGTLTTDRFRELFENESGTDPRRILPAVDRIQPHAGIQAGIYNLPPGRKRGIPSDRQDQSRHGHVQHAGRIENRDGRRAGIPCGQRRRQLLRLRARDRSASPARLSWTPTTVSCASMTTPA